ncbi:hypothetical protein NDI44_08675 [Trichocoleus sp. DQ-A3]|uniref:hypothetical protein n=1 Tax=Cyanophyceae TaxID=3028117 RepID=UPI0016842704|nr:hypothetical protein [Coleofasciculus sp. FACHB-125]MBD1899265.1 hypothetical protein [Coleofasciculus sp. FACHB-125]
MSGLTGDDLKATTAEGLALEALMKLQALERTPAKNPDNRNFVTGTYNSDTGVFSGTYSFPVIQTIDATTGNLTLVADEYLED